MTTENNNQETAIKFGVVLPETAKQLDWQEPTTFYWVKYKGNYEIVIALKKNVFNVHFAFFLERPQSANNDYFHSEKLEDFIPAPTMQEIARELPNVINIPKHNYIGGCPFRLCNENYQLFYHNDHNSIGFDTTVSIKNYHFAQAYAELFLKIRNAGLLKKEEQDA